MDLLIVLVVLGLVVLFLLSGSAPIRTRSGVSIYRRRGEKDRDLDDSFERPRDESDLI